MGWGRMFLLGDLGQQMDLGDHEQALDGLKRRLAAGAARLTETNKELQRLATENNELKLYVAALFRILVAQQIVTPEELRSLVQRIDAEDGTVDDAWAGRVLPD